MHDKRVEDRVREYRWPEISPDVRQRVMAAPFSPVEPVTWSERVWFSRAWRLSLAAAVVVLVALDQLGPAGPSRLTAPPQVLAEAQAIEALATAAGLPETTAAWLARRSVLEASSPRATRQPGAGVLETLTLDPTGGM